jgi:hypothetical protein
LSLFGTPNLAGRAQTRTTRVNIVLGFEFFGAASPPHNLEFAESPVDFGHAPPLNRDRSNGMNSDAKGI